MPRPSYRTSGVRKMMRRGSRVTKMVYKNKKVARASCALCKSEVLGVPQKRDFEMKKLSKSARRPEALFGGELCSPCRHNVSVEATLVSAGVKPLENVAFKEAKYVNVVLGRL